MTINPDKFFNSIRSSLFKGKLNQSQVDNINAILKAWDESKFTDLRWLAYMLATTYHETAFTMVPIREYGSDAYLTKMYDIKGDRPSLAKLNGNTTPGDGIKYCGRGFVQLTWKNNYDKMGKLIGVDLVTNPDKALEVPIATKILFEGMTKSNSGVGDFTGKCLENYFSPTNEDWVDARRIINGLDRANTIAGYAKSFYAALK